MVPDQLSPCSPVGDSKVGGFCVGYGNVAYKWTHLESWDGGDTRSTGEGDIVGTSIDKWHQLAGKQVYIGGRLIFSFSRVAVRHEVKYWDIHEGRKGKNEEKWIVRRKESGAVSNGANGFQVYPQRRGSLPQDDVRGTWRAISALSSRLSGGNLNGQTGDPPNGDDATWSCKEVRSSNQGRVVESQIRYTTTEGKRNVYR